MCILQFFYYVDGDRGDLPDTCDLEYGKPQDCTKLFLKHLI